MGFRSNERNISTVLADIREWRLVVAEDGTTETSGLLNAQMID
jgi:hypothetical protein